MKPPARVGALVIVGTPIGNLGDLAPRAVEALAAADVIACEDTRRTRALLTHAGISSGGRLLAVHQHNERARADEIVKRVRAGARVAYVTDAGMPGVSDPGEHLVAACRSDGLSVEVVPGPSAALAALVLSGLPTRRFVFEGFLDRRGPARRKRLAALAAENRTAVVFEAPHRVQATLVDLRDACDPERAVAVVREITKVHEHVWTGRLADAAAAASDPKGEYVIVLAGASDDAPAPDGDVVDAVTEALDAGLSGRDAAAQVAARLGVSRRRAYDAVLATRASRSVEPGSGAAPLGSARRPTSPTDLGVGP